MMPAGRDDRDDTTSRRLPALQVCDSWYWSCDALCSSRQPTVGMRGILGAIDDTKELVVVFVRVYRRLCIEGMYIDMSSWGQSRAAFTLTRPMGGIEGT